MIEEAKRDDEVDIHVREGAIIITFESELRSGWAEPQKQLHDARDDIMLDDSIATQFDETEWKRQNQRKSNVET